MINDFLCSIKKVIGWFPNIGNVRWNVVRIDKPVIFLKKKLLSQPFILLLTNASITNRAGTAIGIIITVIISRYFVRGLLTTCPVVLFLCRCSQFFYRRMHPASFPLSRCFFGHPKLHRLLSLPPLNWQFRPGKSQKEKIVSVPSFSFLSEIKIKNKFKKW